MSEEINELKHKAIDRYYDGVMAFMPIAFLKVEGESAIVPRYNIFKPNSEKIKDIISQTELVRDLLSKLDNTPKRYVRIRAKILSDISSCNNLIRYIARNTNIGED